MKNSQLSSPLRRSPRLDFLAIRYRLVLASVAILLLLVGFAAGRFVTLRQLAAAAEVNTPAVNVPDPVVDALPHFDAPGADIEGLPRYPSAVRVEYRQVIVGNYVETEVEYVVAADLEPVHDFYRHVFDEEGWLVVDLGIYQGEWTFFVVSGDREALVELEARQSLVEIEIEISEPHREIGN